MTVLPAGQLSVSWGRGMDEAVIWDVRRQKRLLSQSFINHVTNYQNWSVRSSILSGFPEVERMIWLD